MKEVGAHNYPMMARAPVILFVLSTTLQSVATDSDRPSGSVDPPDGRVDDYVAYYDTAEAPAIREVTLVSPGRPPRTCGREQSDRSHGIGAGLALRRALLPPLAPYHHRTMAPRTSHRSYFPGRLESHPPFWRETRI